MDSILILTDLEGTAGVSSFDLHVLTTAPYLDSARRLATAEVNAAIEGFLAAGVTDVLVYDGHGCEGLWYEDLHPAARYLHGRPLAPRSVLDGVLDTFDAFAIIGQHAMAGVATSNMNHTQSSTEIDFIKLNGVAIGEIAQFALYRGATGMPFIFLAGERAACDEAQALVPGVGVVAVKEGLGRASAISLSVSEARRRLREGAEQAVKAHRAAPVLPVQWEGPYRLEKRYFHTDAADACAALPGAERLDGQTVAFRADRIRDVIYS